MRLIEAPIFPIDISAAPVGQADLPGRARWLGCVNRLPGTGDGGRPGKTYLCGGVSRKVARRKS
jgi:hypothetical protein